uniref:Uncharacterized protein n=1 Tax=Steinernema glaseri TaxID=37863 RepID=A0A1I7ZE08_9BILA
MSLMRTRQRSAEDEMHGTVLMKPLAGPNYRGRSLFREEHQAGNVAVGKRLRRLIGTKTKRATDVGAIGFPKAAHNAINVMASKVAENERE